MTPTTTETTHDHWATQFEFDNGDFTPSPIQQRLARKDAVSDDSPKYPRTCFHCARPAYYDTADDAYHHAINAPLGCFLIGPEDRPDDATHPLYLDYVSQAVIDHLNRDLGCNAVWWHSGGGIFGILVTTFAGTVLFTTLEAAGDPDQAEWLGVDVNGREGDLICNASVEARPIGLTNYAPASPREFAEALARLAHALR